ncbi:protein-L-isoaspartate O-methyltransferase [Streptomyces sp. NPDC006704]|uniref:protein-L-isoaspartate O-methyltransferase family protein n=1 Tax=Streptomyces sp. NPDC006704 TaxID=3364760 RepID=UPI003690809D
MDYRAIARKELEAMGAFRSPWLRPAFNAVDREAFAPSKFWGYDTDSDGRHHVIDRKADEDSWRRAVWNTHRSLITQMDDGTTPDAGPTKGNFSSSISALDIVFEKLNQLEVEPGQKVLHIGTASGYDSALLSEGVGSENLTTVEFDQTLAVWGAENLHAAGYTPETIWGDGLEGWKSSAPYDRIISTAAISSVPSQWLAQSKRGAVILAPYNTLFCYGGLLKLRVSAGIASGRFVGGACYMWVRSHRPSNQLNVPDDKRQEASPIDPEEILGLGWPARFAVGLYVPDIAFTHRGEGESKQVQLWDEDGTSVAIVDYDEWWHPESVTLYGERNLWAEVVQAYTAWRLADQPHFTRYGLTVDDVGEQLWLDDPYNLLEPMR